MAYDFKMIERLEKTIEKKLNKLPPDEITGITNGFSLDDGGHVVGLNLWNCNLTDLNPLQGLTKLNRLDLRNNKITYLPVFISQWES